METFGQFPFMVALD